MPPMKGARTDFLSTAPLAAAGAVLVLLAVTAWPLAALTRAALESDLLNLIRTDEELQQAFLWASGMATAACALGVFFGVVSAYCWARLRYPGRTLLRGLAVAPLAVPAIVLASGIEALFAPGRLAADLVAFVGIDPARMRSGTGAVIVAHGLVATAAVGWFASVAWANVDARKVDAARTLGAGQLRAARVAVWPAVWPSALAGAGSAFLQAMLSYGVIVILADGRETPEGLAVRLALASDGRAAAVALLTGGYALLCGLVTIQLVRSPQVEAQRTRARQRARGFDRLAILIAAAPAILMLGLTSVLCLQAVEAEDGLTAHYVRGLAEGPGASVIRHAALGSLLAAIPAAALTAIWGGMAGAALGRMRGFGGMVRAVALLFPLAASPVALALGWRLALPDLDPRITLPAVQAFVAFPFVAGTIARMRPRPRPGTVAAARALGARRLRAWQVLRGPSYVIAACVGFLVAFGLTLGETAAASIARVPGGTLPTHLLDLHRRGADGEAAALAAAILVIAVGAFVLGDPIIARLGRARR
jgi:thiamine transport system permease protein